MSEEQVFQRIQEYTDVVNELIKKLTSNLWKERRRSYRKTSNFKKTRADRDKRDNIENILRYYENN